MTRLREALEKAAGQQSGDPARTARSSQFSDPTQLVPDAWDFDLKPSDPALAAIVPDALDARPDKAEAARPQTNGGRRAESRAAIMASTAPSLTKGPIRTESSHGSPIRIRS